MSLPASHLSLLSSETALSSLLLYPTLTSTREPSRIDSAHDFFILHPLSIQSPSPIGPQDRDSGFLEVQPTRDSKRGRRRWGRGGEVLSEFPKPRPARPQRPLLRQLGWEWKGRRLLCALPAAQACLCEPFPARPHRKHQDPAPQ